MEVSDNAADISALKRDNDTNEAQSAEKNVSQTVRDNRKYAHWWPEVAAMLLSTVFLAVIVAVLLKVDGTPLEKWSMPWHVKPNTLVSVLITACRFFMIAVLAEGLSQLKWIYFEQRPHRLADFQVFDDASRGAWGAAQFVAKIRWRALVASIGALLVVLTLAMDAFAQQLVSYEVRSVSNMTAGISAARIYDAGTQYGSPHLSGDPGGTPFAMIKAASVGLFSREYPIDFSCASGNCTWPPFRTLGICSDCKDVSSDLEKTCTSKNEPNNPWKSQTCHYTTPQGATLKADYTCASPLDEVNSRTIWDVISDPSNVGAMGGTALANVSAIRFPYPDPDPEYDDDGLVVRCPLPDPTAWDCELSWCARTYAATTSTDGKLSDIVTHSEPLQLMQEPSNSCPDQDYGYYARGSSFLVALVAAFVPLEMPAVSTCMDQKLFNESTNAFWINVGDFLTFYDELQAFFSGSIAKGKQNPDGAVALAANMQAMYANNGGNFSESMRIMATSMTNFVRQGPNTTAVRGHTSYSSTHISINWPWLCFPAALVLVAVVFLIAAAVFSRESSKIVWKSSSLAVLFHGLEGWNEHEVVSRDAHDMQVIANDMWAKLNENNDGNLRLIRS